LYSSPNIIRMFKSRTMRWAWHVPHIGKRNAHRVLVGKPKGKRLVGSLRRKWEDNSEMDLR
jgi:hypothetical protein